MDDIPYANIVILLCTLWSSHALTYLMLWVWLAGSCIILNGLIDKLLNEFFIIWKDHLEEESWFMVKLEGLIEMFH